MSSIRSNLFFASISQGLRYLAPLAAYPLLTRRLGVEAFAQFSTLLAVGMVSALFVEFGYGLHSVRELAAREGNEAASTVGILCTGRAITLAITALSLIIFFIIRDQSLSDYAFALSVAVAYGFSASWYFIAMEDSRTLALIDLLSALSTLALVWLYVSGPSDVGVAMACISLPLVIANAYGHACAIRRLGFKLPALRDAAASIRNSAYFFFFTGFPSITGRWGVIAVSISSSPSQIAVFAAADKVVTAAINSTVPISRVLLPRVARAAVTDMKHALSTINKMLCGTAALFSTCAIATCLLSQPVLEFLFKGENLGSDGLGIFVAQILVIPVAACARLLTQVGLVSFKLERIAAVASILVAIIYVPVAFSVGSSGNSPIIIVILRIILEGASFATLLLLFRHHIRRKLKSD